MFSLTISVLTNCPGYSIEGNIQCHIVQSYSTTDGYVQSCRKFCQAPVLVGRVNDCRKFCQTPVLAGCVSDFQNFRVDIQSCQWRNNKTNLKKSKTRQRHQTLCVYFFCIKILFYFEEFLFLFLNFTNCDELLYCDMIYTPDTFIVIHLCILMCVNHVIKCYICQSVCLSFISITYIQLHYMCSHSSSQVSVSVLKAMCAVRVRKSCLLRMLYTSITTP